MTIDMRSYMLKAGEFLGNIIEKVATSKSTRTLLSETSEDEETLQSKTQKFFSPDLGLGAVGICFAVYWIYRMVLNRKI
ncbi:MAG: hypothetical protein ACRD8Z_18020 [Nitrososphaeraceae archaeon]